MQVSVWSVNDLQLQCINQQSGGAKSGELVITEQTVLQCCKEQGVSHQLRKFMKQRVRASLHQWTHVSSFKFPGIHISEDLTWSSSTTVLSRKHSNGGFSWGRWSWSAQQLLVTFYRCTTKDILMIGKLSTGSSPLHWRPLGYSSKPWRTPTAHAASGKLPAFVRISPKQAIVCLNSSIWQHYNITSTPLHWDMASSPEP